MTQLGTVDAVVGVTDGRVNISADVEAALYIETPDNQPLTAAESHATVRLTGDGVNATVQLDAEALDALGDAVSHAQGGGEGQ